MPFPRPRFTVRRLMVAVAIAAVGLASLNPILLRLRKRSAEFANIADLHNMISNVYTLGTPPPGGSWCEHSQPCSLPACKSMYAKSRIYYAGLSRKYEFAARYPFLPLLPDPPEPK